MSLKTALSCLALTAMPPQAAAPSRAATWWADLAAIADDANQGRDPATAGFLRAADFVERRFRAIGLRGAGTDGGFRQQVPLEEQTIDYARSHATLVGTDGSTKPVALGGEMLVAAWSGPRPATVDAPLVFLGYGLHLPDQGYDDLAGIDVVGKVAVLIEGGPANLPASVKASGRSEFGKLLAKAGAVGMITLTSARRMEIPWDRQMLLSNQSSLYLADAALRTLPDGFFLASMSPDAGARLFAGSGRDFTMIAAASAASAKLATFALPTRLVAEIAAHRRRLSSPNLLARLDGSDPRLAPEHVVISAHLDHVGIGPPIARDRIYNGAIDDGSGVATVLDLARRLHDGPRPKRSILFLIATAEESGLLGSSYFVANPTVPRATLVADINFDVLLPLWPLTSILALGDDESDLGDVAAVTAARQSLVLIPDPLPDRNSFVRTDQYSFVRVGIPALALKFGFPPGSEAFRIEGRWRAERYHAPQDDIHQPGILVGEAMRFDDYAADVVYGIANRAARPQWRGTSRFRPPMR